MKRSLLFACAAALLLGLNPVLHTQTLKTFVTQQAEEAGLIIEGGEDDWVKIPFHMARGTVQTAYISKVTEGTFRTALIEIAVPSFKTSELTEQELVAIGLAMLQGNYTYEAGSWAITGEDPYFLLVHNIPGDLYLTYDGERLRSLLEYMASIVDQTETNVQAYLAENRAGAKRGDADENTELETVLSGLKRSGKTGGLGGGMTLRK
ncbi:MAG: hypothetical protein JXA28_07355 [Bacteroidetes bacterium]|nr:hypothetical protein [Bacteroidota bacterium]